MKCGIFWLEECASCGRKYNTSAIWSASHYLRVNHVKQHEAVFHHKNNSPSNDNLTYNIIENI